MKKLILLDDHKMLRKGISSYIAENTNWQIAFDTGDTAELEEFLKTFKKSDDDTVIAVVDLQLKRESSKSDGFKAIKILRQYDIPSVVFSSHDSAACIESAMSAESGARGFVSKRSDEKTLLDAIEAVSKGETFVQPNLISGLLNLHSLFFMLTKREQQVVRLIASGLKNEQVASELGIKLVTLENYLSVIYDKLGCRDKAALVEKLN